MSPKNSDVLYYVMLIFALGFIAAVAFPMTATVFTPDAHEIKEAQTSKPNPVRVPVSTDGALQQHAAEKGI